MLLKYINRQSGYFLCLIIYNRLYLFFTMMRRVTRGHILNGGSICIIYVLTLKLTVFAQLIFISMLDFILITADVLLAFRIYEFA